MRFNAHLIQSQGNVGDIGVSPYYNADTLGIADYTTILDRSSSAIPTTLGQEVQYRNAYIDRIFSSKKNGGSTANYKRFYGSSTYGPTVYPNEIPTMGQVSDWMLRPRVVDPLTDIITFRGGVLDYLYGNTKSTDTSLNLYNVFDAGRYYPEPPISVAVWRDNQNLLYRLNKIFELLFNNSSDSNSGFYLHAYRIFGGGLSIGQADADTLRVRTFSSGTDTGFPYNHEIFQVTGQDVSLGYRSINLLYNNNDNGTIRPVGIKGGNGYVGTESFSNYGTGTAYSFIDVTRYILRESDEQRYRNSMLIWLNRYYASSTDCARFNFGAYGIMVERPDEASGPNPYLVSTRPRSSRPLTLYCYSVSPVVANYNFHLQFNDIYTGLRIKSNTSGGWKNALIRHTDQDQRLTIRNGEFADTNAYDVYFNWLGIMNASFENASGMTRPYNEPDHHVLMSDACERIYGKIDSNGADLKFLLFSTYTSKLYNPMNYAALGAYRYEAQRYGICAYEYYNGTIYKCVVPKLTSTTSEFIVTRPEIAQNIYADNLTITNISLGANINLQTDNGAGYSAISSTTGKINLDKIGQLRIFSTANKILTITNDLDADKAVTGSNLVGGSAELVMPSSLTITNIETIVNFDSQLGPYGVDVNPHIDTPGDHHIYITQSGIYLISFSCIGFIDTIGKTVTFVVYKDGDAIFNSIQIRGSTASTYDNFSFSSVTQIDANSKVMLKVQYSPDAGSIDLTNIVGKLTVVKVGAA